MKFFLNSGEEVVIENSHLQKEVIDMLPLALEKINGLGRQYIREEVSFAEVIGKDHCVATRTKDKVLYAKRLGKSGASRFVKNREPEDTNKFSVVLKQAPGYRKYTLVNAFFGKMAPPEVWDVYAFQESRRFWLTHAFVWGSEETHAGTETIFCPW